MLCFSLLNWVGKSYHFSPVEGEIFFIQKQQFTYIYILLILSEMCQKPVFSMLFCFCLFYAVQAFDKRVNVCIAADVYFLGGLAGGMVSGIAWRQSLSFNCFKICNIVESQFKLNQHPKNLSRNRMGRKTYRPSRSN